MQTIDRLNDARRVFLAGLNMNTYNNSSGEIPHSAFHDMIKAEALENSNTCSAGPSPAERLYSRSTDLLYPAGAGVWRERTNAPPAVAQRLQDEDDYLERMRRAADMLRDVQQQQHAYRHRHSGLTPGTPDHAVSAPGVSEDTSQLGKFYYAEFNALRDKEEELRYLKVKEETLRLLYQNSLRRDAFVGLKEKTARDIAFYTGQLKYGKGPPVLVGEVTNPYATAASAPVLVPVVPSVLSSPLSIGDGNSAAGHPAHLSSPRGSRDTPPLERPPRPTFIDINNGFSGERDGSSGDYGPWENQSNLSQQRYHQQQHQYHYHHQQQLQLQPVTCLNSDGSVFLDNPMVSPAPEELPRFARIETSGAYDSGPNSLLHSYDASANSALGTGPGGGGGRRSKLSRTLPFPASPEGDRAISEGSGTDHLGASDDTAENRGAAADSFDEGTSTGLSAPPYLRPKALRAGSTVIQQPPQQYQPSPHTLTVTTHPVRPSLASGPTTAAREDPPSLVEESARALELLSLVRVLRRNTLNMTRLLLEATGETGCWNRENEGSVSSPDTAPSLFRDLFISQPRYYANSTRTRKRRRAVDFWRQFASSPSHNISTTPHEMAAGGGESSVSPHTVASINHRFAILFMVPFETDSYFDTPDAQSPRNERSGSQHHNPNHHLERIPPAPSTSDLLSINFSHGRNNGLFPPAAAYRVFDEQRRQFLQQRAQQREEAAAHHLSGDADAAQQQQQRQKSFIVSAPGSDALHRQQHDGSEERGEGNAPNALGCGETEDGRVATLRRQLESARSRNSCRNGSSTTANAGETAATTTPEKINQSGEPRTPTWFPYLRELLLTAPAASEEEEQRGGASPARREREMLAAAIGQYLARRGSSGAGATADAAAATPFTSKADIRAALTQVEGLISAHTSRNSTPHRGPGHAAWGPQELSTSSPKVALHPQSAEEKEKEPGQEKSEGGDGDDCYVAARNWLHQMQARGDRQLQGRGRVLQEQQEEDADDIDGLPPLGVLVRVQAYLQELNDEIASAGSQRRSSPPTDDAAARPSLERHVLSVEGPEKMADSEAKANSTVEAADGGADVSQSNGLEPPPSNDVREDANAAPAREDPAAAADDKKAESGPLQQEQQRRRSSGKRESRRGSRTSRDRSRSDWRSDVPASDAEPNGRACSSRDDRDSSYSYYSYSTSSSSRSSEPREIIPDTSVAVDASASTYRNGDANSKHNRNAMNHRETAPDAVASVAVPPSSSAAVYAAAEALPLAESLPPSDDPGVPGPLPVFDYARARRHRAKEARKAEKLAEQQHQKQQKLAGDAAAAVGSGGGGGDSLLSSTTATNVAGKKKKKKGFLRFFMCK